MVDGPHDLGGRPGFGPVPVEADRPWTAHWQPLALALAGLTARLARVNGDAVRHVMERIPADEYVRLGSAGRWLRVAERCALEGGLVAEGEVADRGRRRAAGLAPAAVGSYPEPARTMPTAGVPPHSKRVPGDGDHPRFAVGDRVLVRDHRPEGHTRLPGYLRGRRGEVVLVNGYWVYPDSHAHFGPEAPTWVYARPLRRRRALADRWVARGARRPVRALPGG